MFTTITVHGIALHEFWNVVSTLQASQVALVVKKLPANAGDIRDVCLIPGQERSPGEGNGNPLQYSCPENPTDRGAWWAAVHGVAELDTNEVTWPTWILSAFTSTSNSRCQNPTAWTCAC